MGISIACFDLYGTLLDLAALRDAVRAYTPMVDAVCEQWRRRQLQLANAATSSGRYTDFDRLTLTALHEIAPRFHLHLAPTDQKRLIDAWAELPPFADAAHALQEVRRRGLPSYVLTNGVPSTANNAIAHAGIAPWIDRVFSADAVKAFKPSRAVYAQILGEGVEAHNVVFFSANDWDAIGARQAGFHSVFVNRRPANAGPKAERTIGGLDEIGLVLDDLREP